MNVANLIPLSQVAEYLQKKSFKEATAERFAAKWKCMKERFQELSEKGNKQSGGKQLWTYEKMHSILGYEDTITLEHIQEVGSCHGVKNRKIHGDSGCQSKRQKSRVSNAELLERLIGICF